MEEGLSVENFIFDTFYMYSTPEGYSVTLSYKGYDYYINFEDYTNLIDEIIKGLKRNRDSLHKEYKKDIYKYLKQIPKDRFNKDRWVFDSLKIDILERPSNEEDEFHNSYFFTVSAVVSGVQYNCYFSVKGRDKQKNIFKFFVFNMEDIIKNIIIDVKNKGFEAFNCGNIYVNNRNVDYSFYYGETVEVTGNVSRIDENTIQYDILNKCNKALYLLEEVF